MASVDVLGSDGAVETITGTTIHPFWSVDRQEWVPLAELAQGERFQGLDGLADVLSVTLSRVSQPVYNIEVHGEHVYQVGELGLVVHNSCPAFHHFAPRAFGSNVPYGPGYLKFLNASEHTDIHRAFSDFLKVKQGHYFNAKSGSWWQANVSKFDRIKTLIEFHRFYRGGHYYSDFVNEVRAAIKAGYNPFG